MNKFTTRRTAKRLIITALCIIAAAVLVVTALEVGAHDEGAVYFYEAELAGIALTAVAGLLFVVSMFLPNPKE